MELVLPSNRIVNWRFEAAKRLETPKNIGEFILRVPEIIATFLDRSGFEINFRISWFFRRIIFQ